MTADIVSRASQATRFTRAVQMVTGRMRELNIAVAEAGHPVRWAVDVLVGNALQELERKTHRPYMLNVTAPPHTVLLAALELLARGICTEAFVDGGGADNGALIVY